ncbi:MAG: sensor histidine kinase [Synechococcus sp.]
MRLWLQSSSLLAVVAGYSVLLLIHQQVATWQRNQTYRQSSVQLISSLGRRAGTRAELKQLLDASGTVPGLSVKITEVSTGEASGEPSLIRRGSSKWLVGTLPLDLLDGSRVALLVQQDVTASVAQERLGFWLLVMAAGVSSLITSVLLRLVLRRGLVQPLRDFSNELASFKAPPNPNDVISLEQQPRELQPIAEAFNALQGRMVNSWNRERAFADGVAHELRTPITLIWGHSQRLLKQQAGLEGSHDSLQLICRESERMRSLVSDLLDLARRDAGRLSLKRERIVVEDALIELFERLECQAAGRLRLDLKHESRDASPVVVGDQDRLQQCLTTLVDNALLYSSASVGVSWSQPSADTVLLHVRDQGPGVVPEERDWIFERFVRGAAGLNSPERGSGIGLSMVKLLMEAMGGSVQVCDADGGGADFQLQLMTFRPSDRRP